MVAVNLGRGAFLRPASKGYHRNITGMKNHFRTAKRTKCTNSLADGKTEVKDFYMQKNGFHSHHMPRKMRRKVCQNMGILTFFKNHFEKKVANETTHNVGIADQKILSDSIFDHFL